MADGIKIRGLNLTSSVKRDDVLIIDKLNTLTNENITYQILVDDFANAIIANPDNKLSSLADVVIVDPSPGESLVFNGNYWTNEKLETGGGSFEGDAIAFTTSEVPVVFKVTVGDRTPAHRFQDSPSTKAFYIDGVEAPSLMLSPGRKYRFDQSDPSNIGYTLLFYSTPTNTAFFGNAYNEPKLNDTAYFGIPGQEGAFSEVVFTQKYNLLGSEWALEVESPRTLFYNCSSNLGDDFMGNSLFNIGRIEDSSFDIGDGSGGGIFPMTILELHNRIQELEEHVTQLIQIE